MKKLFFAAISLVCLMACSQDETLTSIDNPISGQEVQFTSMVGEATRTLYAEAYANSQAVKWVDGDLISVYGVDCSVKQAEYKVTAATDAAVVDGKNYYYASSLDKTGAAGVQWGENNTSDFYAVYPSTSNSFVDNGDGSVTVKTTVRENQHLVCTKTTASDGTVTWVGQHYHIDNSPSNPTMTDAVMYAVTKDAAATNADGTAKSVDLNFKPFSTVLRFTFKGYQAYKDTGAEDQDYNSTISVTKITLTAPNAYIAGDFDLTINNAGTATAGTGTSKIITLYPDYLPMANMDQLQFDVFTIPQAHTLPGDDEQAWKVDLETNYGTFSYNLIPKKADVATDATLKAGQIHKLNIPLCKVVTGKFDLTNYAGEWVKYIPRNVYLSELSLPGAWYCTNGDYQSTTDLTEQYKKGIRAFNIDCRMTASASSWSSSWGRYTLNDNPTYLLQCAGSETLEGANVLGGTYVSSVADGKTVESQLELLSEQIKDNEFIMVVLTIAEQPKALKGSLSGNVQAFGNNVDPANVLAAIKDILTRKGKTMKVFGYREQDAGKTLNANTTLQDVLGSMIIKVNVNVDQDVTNLANYDMNYVLLSEGSMASNSAFITGSIVEGSFTSMNVAAMYWGSTAISPAMNYYYHHAQKTKSSPTATSGSSTPSLYDRMMAIDDIIDKAYQIYNKNEHNGLFQLGIGGYIDSSSEDRATVANTLNPYVLNTWVQPKLDGDTKTINGEVVTLKPSPIGIVLMNFCTDNTYKSVDLTNALLKMNTSYYLNRDTSKEEWPDGNPFDTIGGGTIGGEDGDQGNDQD